MGNKYGEIAFTDAVKAVQNQMGSREAYARRENGPDFNDRLGPDERTFITSRDSFFIASVSETGWPYVQFRGGPAGFLRVLDNRTLAYADFSGNHQYITTGNVSSNDRVSLFLMDYPNRRRLKIYGRMVIADISEKPEIAVPEYDAQVERAVLITVEAFEWNCPRHITPRFTQDDLVEVMAPIRQELTKLRSENARLRRLTNPGTEGITS
jgi:uncharacterized protein